MRALLVIVALLAAKAAHAVGFDCLAQGGTSCSGRIPDGYLAFDSSFEIPADACGADATFTGVELVLSLAHTQPGDLVATLSHGGVDASVNELTCCNAAAWQVRFTDAPNATEGCPSVQHSLDALGAFAAGTPGGVWNLSIQDLRRGEYGTLANWSLEIVCTPIVVEPDPDPEPTPEPVVEESPDPEPEPQPEPVPDAPPDPDPEPEAELTAHVHGSTACNGGGLEGLIPLLASLLLTLVPTRSRAEEGVDVRYHAPVPGGDANLVNVHGADVLGHLRFSAGAYLDYAVEPLVLTLGDDDIALIDDELRLDLLVAVGFIDQLELGLALPMIVTSTGHDASNGDASRAFHAGDLRVVPKWRIVDGDFALALAVPLSLPTAGSDYSGSASVTIEPRLIGELDVHPLRVLANVGFRIAPEAASLYDLDVGNELRLALGAALEVIPELDLLGEGIVKIVDEGDTPAELGVGARYSAAGHAVTAMAGFGMSDGYGTPAWHITLGYTFTQPPKVVERLDPNGDEDGDGVINSADACPKKPEDKDGRDDVDGCPDLDDDGDGIPDLVDGPKDERGFGSCKDIAEDLDGFDDKDGCFDPDNDQDGILDAADKCPNKAEAFNNYLDEDGCPDVKKAEIGDKQIDLFETVLFETGQDTLLPESDDLLEQIAAILRDHPEVLKVEVAGHTDEVSTEEFNQRLSERRAARVREMLINKGVAPERLVAKGYGERQPLTKDTTPEALQKNRRVEFRILERKK